MARGASAIGASNLSELLQAIGELSEALAQARKSVELADKSGDADQCMVNRSTLAAALHAMGLQQEASAQFEETERMQKASQLAYPLLYSLRERIRSANAFRGQASAMRPDATPGESTEDPICAARARLRIPSRYRGPSPNVFRVPLDALPEGTPPSQPPAPLAISDAGTTAPSSDAGQDAGSADAGR
jgi:hypothetical protein